MKKRKTLRFIEKNSLNLVAIVVAVIGVLSSYTTRVVVVVENPPNPPAVAQAEWHSVETWQFTVVSGTATPQTHPFDWVGFWSNVAPYVTLAFAGLIGLCNRWKDHNWKKKYEGIVVTKPLLP